MEFKNSHKIITKAEIRKILLNKKAKLMKKENPVNTQPKISEVEKIRNSKVARLLRSIKEDKMKETTKTKENLSKPLTSIKQKFSYWYGRMVEKRAALALAKKKATVNLFKSKQAVRARLAKKVREFDNFEALNKIAYSLTNYIVTSLPEEKLMALKTAGEHKNDAILSSIIEDGPTNIIDIGCNLGLSKNITNIPLMFKGLTLVGVGGIKDASGNKISFIEKQAIKRNLHNRIQKLSKMSSFLLESKLFPTDKVAKRNWDDLTPEEKEIMRANASKYLQDSLRVFDSAAGQYTLTAGDMANDWSDEVQIEFPKDKLKVINVDSGATEIGDSLFKQIFGMLKSDYDKKTDHLATEANIRTIPGLEQNEISLSRKPEFFYDDSKEKIEDDGWEKDEVWGKDEDWEEGKESDPFMKNELFKLTPQSYIKEMDEDSEPGSEWSTLSRAEKEQRAREFFERNHIELDESDFIDEDFDKKEINGEEIEIEGGR